MSHRLTTITRATTAAAWLVAGLDLTPWLDLPANAALYLIALGCVTSYALICRAHARPADEVYLAGKAMGRREAMLEQECERVVRMADRPRGLRVVNGDRADS